MTTQTACEESDTVRAGVREILDRYTEKGRDILIPVLQEVQDRSGYLSRDSIAEIGQALNLPASKIYGVATFYNQFRFRPLGRCHIQICRGTACHVKGSAAILERLKRELGIEPGQTTRDGVFSLEVVACIGACGLAPVITVNGEFHAKLNGDDVPKILDDYRAKAGEE